MSHGHASQKKPPELHMRRFIGPWRDRKTDDDNVAESVGRLRPSNFRLGVGDGEKQIAPEGRCQPLELENYISNIWRGL